MKTILSRRSIRKFTDKPVPDEVLAELAEAAMHAPSALCRKTWVFTVVANKAMIEKLVAAIGKQTGRVGYDMYKPAALVIPSNSKDNPFGKEDNASALQNVFLAAASYGVGSVWINQLQGICDGEYIRPVLNELGIPADHVVYGLAALGYADPSLEAKYREGGTVRFVK